jgi:NADH-quinone oxidoreductase subunit N
MKELLLFPEVQLTLWAIFLLIVDSVRKEVQPQEVARMALLGLALVFAGTWLLPQGDTQEFWARGLYVIDPPALFFKRFFLVAAFFVVWMSVDYVPQFPLARNEFLILPLFTTVGMMLLASAADLITLFVALELVTVSFYILVAYHRDKVASLEAGTKYLVVGALSTGFIVYGIAFLFGTVGSTSLRELEYHLQSSVGAPNLGLLLALTLILVGLGFKVAAVPFHVWAPDVYQGAPTPVTAFLSVASKAAGLVAILRLFVFGGFSHSEIFPLVAPTFALLGILSVILGSFAALTQRNLKRLLGYSSIANAGFILMGLSCLSYRGVEAVGLYLCVYLLATLLIFFILSKVGPVLGGEDLPQFSGLYRRSPLAAVGLLLGFVSLAGIPPLVGFLGKLGIFAAVWEQSEIPLFGLQRGYLILLLVGIIGAVAGLYYYLAPIRSIFWNEPAKDAPAIEFGVSSRVLIVVLSASLLVLGFWPRPLGVAAGSLLRSPAAHVTE